MSNANVDSECRMRMLKVNAESWMGSWMRKATDSALTSNYANNPLSVSINSVQLSQSSVEHRANSTASNRRVVCDLWVEDIHWIVSAEWHLLDCIYWMVSNEQNDPLNDFQWIDTIHWMVSTARRLYPLIQPLESEKSKSFDPLCTMPSIEWLWLNNYSIIIRRSATGQWPFLSASQLSSCVTPSVTPSLSPPHSVQR